MALSTLSQRVMVLVLAISCLLGVAPAKAISPPSRDVVQRQTVPILIEPTLGSPQLWAIAGESFTLYGDSFPTVGALAGVVIDATIFGLVETTSANPITAVVTIPADTTAGVHTLTLNTGGYSATMSVQVCVATTGAGCDPIIGFMSASPSGGVPVDIVYREPELDVAAGFTFKIIGEGFWAGDVSLSINTVPSNSLGNEVADSTGHFVSQVFTMPADILYGEHNVTATQESSCWRWLCFGKSANAYVEFDIYNVNIP